MNTEKLSPYYGNALYHNTTYFALRYLVNEPIIQPGLQMSLGFRDRFFRGPNTTGVDLAALIIQMGRDHGIVSYVEMRESCGLSRPRNFQELKPLLWDSVDSDALQRVYETVDDGDLFVLGLAEKADSGSLVGPTFDCVFARQFSRVSFYNFKAQVT